jgi:hypothetical protein
MTKLALVGLFQQFERSGLPLQYDQAVPRQAMIESFHRTNREEYIRAPYLLSGPLLQCMAPIVIGCADHPLRVMQNQLYEGATHG